MATTCFEQSHSCRRRLSPLAAVLVIISCLSVAALVLILRYPLTTGPKVCPTIAGFYCQKSAGQSALEQCPGMCWCISASTGSTQCGKLVSPASASKWSPWKLAPTLVFFILAVACEVLAAFLCLCRSHDDDNVDEGKMAAVRVDLSSYAATEDSDRGTDEDEVLGDDSTDSESAATSSSSSSSGDVEDGETRSQPLLSAKTRSE